MIFSICRDRIFILHDIIITNNIYIYIHNIFIFYNEYEYRNNRAGVLNLIINRLRVQRIDDTRVCVIWVYTTRIIIIQQWCPEVLHIMSADTYILLHLFRAKLINNCIRAYTTRGVDWFWTEGHFYRSIVVSFFREFFFIFFFLLLHYCNTNNISCIFFMWLFEKK